MLFLPQPFDENDWFMLASIAALAVIIAALPKRLSPRLIIYMIWFNFFSGGNRGFYDCRRPIRHV